MAITYQPWTYCAVVVPFLAAVVAARGLPTVDPGLFVISGVGTCGGGEGYCLLGFDCTLDEDFVADDGNGHCEGLKSAFTPSAHFVCCKDTNRTSRPVVTLPPVPAYATTPDLKENEVDDALIKLVQSVAAVNVAAEMDMKKKKKPVGALEEGKKGDNVESDPTTTEKIDPQSTTVNSEDAVTTVTPEVPGSTDVTESDNSIIEQSELDNQKVSIDSNESNMNSDSSMMSNDTWMAQASDEHDIYESPWDDRNGEKHREWVTSTWETPQDEANEVVESVTIDVKSPQNVINGPTSLLADVHGAVATRYDPSPDTKTDVPPTTMLDMTNPVRDTTSEMPAVKFHRDPDSDQPHHDSTNITSGSEQPQSIENATVTTELQTELPSCGMSARCISMVRFMYDNNVLCYGSPLYWDWTITSASCALRIFRKGMFNISVSPEGSDWSMGGNVRTIIVHESFRAVENPLHLEVNNIGLIRIYPGLGWNLCRACLPREDQEFQGDRCATHPLSQPSSRYYHRGFSDVCEGVTELLPGVGSFLALPCPSTSWSPRSTGSSAGTMGLPLRCDGVLAGVQAAEGVGTRVYTPITPYLDWIKDNIRKGPVPRQAFRSH